METLVWVISRSISLVKDFMESLWFFDFSEIKKETYYLEMYGSQNQQVHFKK